MQRFQELKVWQRSHALVLEIYRPSKSFPADERFALVSQIRRAATSVATNIAEGSKRQQRSDYARFLNIAEGSLAEMEYLLLLSSDHAYLPPDVGVRLADEATDIARMLYALRNKVESRHNSDSL
jgi:four helix bundle protein